MEMEMEMEMDSNMELDGTRRECGKREEGRGIISRDSSRTEDYFCLSATSPLPLSLIFSFYSSSNP